MKQAILVPGIGYTADRPLLYYSKKLARNAGYQIKVIRYSGFPAKRPGEEAYMEQVYDLACRQLEEQLADLTFSSQDDILFLSKSIGTAAAAWIQKKTGLNARNVYFTPVAQTFRTIRSASGIAFHGTADPWTAGFDVEAACRKAGIPCFIYPDANHSLETGDLKTDLNALADILDHCAEYLTPSGH
jgi:phosphoglycolate phosphatase